MGRQALRGCGVKILITGKNGQVGFELQRSLALLGEVVAVDRNECDLANIASIRSTLDVVQPDIILNPAAYTAVDQAESEPGLARAVNAHAPAVFGEWAAPRGSLVVHYSTDYVFDGRKDSPYSEDDAPNPQSVYGQTKREGELALQAAGAKSLIFRTSWVYGAYGNNFVKTILRLAAERDTLKIVADQFGAPTPAALLADATAQVVAQYRHDHGLGTVFPLGLYHLTAMGRTSWHGYAEAIIAAARVAGRPLCLGEGNLLPITTAEYPLPASRPANSCLDTKRFISTFGLALPEWQNGLAHVLRLML